MILINWIGVRDKYKSSIKVVIYFLVLPSTDVLLKNVT